MLLLKPVDSAEHSKKVTAKEVPAPKSSRMRWLLRGDGPKLINQARGGGVLAELTLIIM